MVGRLETRPSTSRVRPSECDPWLMRLSGLSHCSCSTSKASLGQMFQGPIVFADQLLHHVAVLHLGGHDFPRIGFHFKMRTERRLALQCIQDANEMIGRIVK